MTTVRVRVGASLDSSFKEVFRTIEEASKRSRKVIETNAATSNATMQAGYRTNARASIQADEDAARAADKWSKYRARIVENSATMAGRYAKQQADIEIRESERAAKAQERIESGKTRSRRDTMARASRAIVRGASTALSFGARVAGSALRGAGVDFDFASNSRKNVALESNAVNIANASYIEGGKGDSGIRQNPADILRDIKDAANATAVSYEEASEGLSKFVGKTGELGLGRDILKDMGKLAKGTGASLEDMVSAAGDVSIALGDIPNKAEVIKDVMASIAGQGKLGTAEVKDLAKNMAKIAAQAPQYEGNIADNIKDLGIFAQMARKGGASSATMQATSVAAMTNTFKTPARMAAFEAAHVEVIGQNGMIRKAKDIMMDALRVAGTDPAKFKTMYGNVQGEKAVAGFGNIYKQAYGSPAMAGKTKAQREEYALSKVNEEWDEFKRAQVTQTELMGSFGLAMQTTASKAQLLNNKFQDVTGELQKAITPVAIALTEALLPAVQGLAAFMNKTLGTDEPGEQRSDIAASIGADNAKEKIEEVRRSKIITPAEEAAFDQVEKDLRSRAHAAQLKANEANESGTGTFLGGMVATAIGQRKEFFNAKGEHGAQAQSTATLLNQQANETAAAIKALHVDLKSGVIRTVPPPATKTDSSGTTVSTKVPGT